MTKNKAIYIGSTPQNVSRETNEAELRRYAEKSKALQDNLNKIRIGNNKHVNYPYLNSNEFWNGDSWLPLNTLSLADMTASLF